MEKKMALAVVVRVCGFHDAKRWAYNLIREGMVKCEGGKCDNPATHISWQDQAEWYALCNEHRMSGDMWTGSTRWNPREIRLTVLPSIAHKWYDELDPETKKKVKLEEYDATNYYELLDKGVEPIITTIQGEEDAGWRVDVQVRALTNGQFVYDITRYRGMTIHGEAIIGMFVSAEDALLAARADYSRGKL